MTVRIRSLLCLSRALQSPAISSLFDRLYKSLKHVFVKKSHVGHVICLPGRLSASQIIHLPSVFEFAYINCHVLDMIYYTVSVPIVT
jgi:hypothetical protein